MNLRTPLGRVLGLGTAKDGTSHWWAQRVSGAGLAILGLWFAWAIATMPGYDHASAVAFIGKPVNAVLLLLLTVTMGYHSYLGVQVVIDREFPTERGNIVGIGPAADGSPEGRGTDGTSCVFHLSVLMGRRDIRLKPDCLALVANHHSVGRVAAGSGETFVGLIRHHTTDSNAAESTTTDGTEVNGVLRAHGDA